jgi:hypothetical protein
MTEPGRGMAAHGLPLPFCEANSNHQASPEGRLSSICPYREGTGPLPLVRGGGASAPAVASCSESAVRRVLCWEVAA